MELEIKTEWSARLAVYQFDGDNELWIMVDGQTSFSQIFLSPNEVRTLRDYLTAQLIEIGAETPKTT